MIDISKIRPGDEVTVRAKVTHSVPRPDMAHVAFANGGPYLWVTSEMIDMHIPAPREIKVRDLVKHSDFTIKLKVIHLHNGYAWLEKDWPGEGVIRPVSELTHAENDDGR